MKLVISTFNIQNKYNDINFYSGYVEELINLIDNYHIDIMGVQELTRKYKNKLINIIDSNYKVIGKYRYTWLGNIIPYVKKYNESNSIITNKKVIRYKTKYLPFFPSIPRIVTIIDILLNNKKIRVINTHLDNKSKTAKYKQLNSIKKILKESNIESILMGDFNITINNEVFMKFINELKDIGYKRVDANFSTHKINKYPIDHIFIPSKWEVNKIEILKIDSKISDHKPIIIDVTI